MEDYVELINKTSIITDKNNVTNIKNNPNLECEDCEDGENGEEGENDDKYNNEMGSTWIRLRKTDFRYDVILRYFDVNVKDYRIKDIKRIFYSENESVYILCSQSKYCTNIGKNHNSEHIYFKLNKKGICQKCFCKCDTLNGRQNGYCKDYSSTIIPLTDFVRKS